MNAVSPQGEFSVTDVDMLIVGAGISGIGMAVHLREKCRSKSYAIIERRADLGGTWDLFRYPGIRSDSDMHTLGFEFEPWTHEKSIADGPAILEYLNKIVDDRDIRRNIRFGSKVLSADWDSATARWTLTLEDDAGRTRQMTGKFPRRREERRVAGIHGNDLLAGHCRIHFFLHRRRDRLVVEAFDIHARNTPILFCTGTERRIAGQQWLRAQRQPRQGDIFV